LKSELYTARQVLCHLSHISNLFLLWLFFEIRSHVYARASLDWNLPISASCVVVIISM
jgi:hypothetical protein